MADARLGVLRRSFLRKSLRSKNPVELIIKTSQRQKEWLARELGRVGDVTNVYNSVPFLSFRCESSEAYRLNAVFRKKSGDHAYRSVASAISSIDAASRMSMPSVKVGKPGAKSGFWNLEDIGAYSAKEIASGSGVSVAVIDTGVDYSHPELSGRFGSVKGYDFIRKNSSPMDKNGHGTHVAGIAMGINCGIASSASCYALRVLDETGSGIESDVVAALDWAAGHEVDVVNLSLGSPYASSALEDICYYLADKGVLVIAAAGNSGFGPNYPAAFGDPVIAVAAVDESNRHPNFSNIYETNDISAPGVNINSSYLGGYAVLSGTSMASPHVAGSFALVLSAMKSGGDLEELLESTAQKLEPGNFPERDVYGAGLLRVDLMVNAVAGSRRSGIGENYGREVLGILREVFWK